MDYNSNYNYTYNFELLLYNIIIFLRNWLICKKSLTQCKQSQPIFVPLYKKIAEKDKNVKIIIEFLLENDIIS